MDKETKPELSAMEETIRNAPLWIRVMRSIKLPSRQTTETRPHSYSYYWRLLKWCGEESYRTWRSEMLAGVVILFAIYMLTSARQADAWENFLVSLQGTAIGLALFGLFHLARAPWIAEQNREGKEREPHLFFGVFGICILAGILVGGVWGGFALYRAHGLAIEQNRTLTATNQQLTAENLKLKNAPLQIQYVSVEPPKESANSLRRRTIKLVNDLNTFWSRLSAPNQVSVQNPSTDEERQRNAKWDQYWRDATTAYLNAGFKERILGIVREYKSKGIETGYLEPAAEQQPTRLIGAAPFGGFALDDCSRYTNDLCQLRELAYHVDANDQRIELTAK